MVYCTYRCPHCNNIVGKQTNPVDKIGNPFDLCPYCGQVYKSSNKEEWLTKSPFKRLWFFIGRGCFARAIVIPFFLVFGLGLSVGINSSLLQYIYFFSFISYLVAGYFVHKNLNELNIKESLERTQDKSYLDLLKRSGYKIYPIKDYIVKDIGNTFTEKNVEGQEIKLETDIGKLVEDSNNGDNEASLTLGYVYLHGENGVEKNKELAILLFKKAKEQGNEYADNILNELENVNDI